MMKLRLTMVKHEHCVPIFRRSQTRQWDADQRPASKKPLQVFDLQRLRFLLAEWTGLEPATPGVTGRYSNQLNYHSW